jgi:hypothetical protein
MTRVRSIEPLDNLSTGSGAKTNSAPLPIAIASMSGWFGRDRMSYENRGVCAMRQADLFCKGQEVHALEGGNRGAVFLPFLAHL